MTQRGESAVPPAAELRLDSVTVVIEHQVRPGLDRDYEGWLKRLEAAGAELNDGRGVVVIPPAREMRTYTIFLRFETLAAAQWWLRSDIRRTLLEQAKPLLSHPEHVAMRSGLEFWFRLHGEPGEPSRLAQSLITLIVLFPLTLVIPDLYRRLAAPSRFFANPLVGNAIVDALIVLLLSYALMPLVTKLLVHFDRS